MPRMQFSPPRRVLRVSSSRTTEVRPSIIMRCDLRLIFRLHIGRQLDFARSGIEILEEVMRELRKRDLLKNGFEV